MAIYAEISRRLLRRFLAQLREVMAREDVDLHAAIREVCRVAVEASTEEVYRTAIVEIAAWLRQRLDDPPDDLSERVFMAFASVRGAVLLSMLYPELAPTSELLVEQLATVMLGFLTAKPK